MNGCLRRHRKFSTSIRSLLVHFSVGVMKRCVTQKALTHPTSVHAYPAAKLLHNAVAATN
jgi:hypothetical protein